MRLGRSGHVDHHELDPNPSVVFEKLSDAILSKVSEKPLNNHIQITEQNRMAGRGAARPSQGWLGRSRHWPQALTICRCDCRRIPSSSAPQSPFGTSQMSPSISPCASYTERKATGRVLACCHTRRQPDSRPGVVRGKNGFQIYNYHSRKGWRRHSPGPTYCGGWPPMVGQRRQGHQAVKSGYHLQRS